MISILIRNRNEKKDLEFLLDILATRYKGEYDEIIVVDNASTDGSQQVAEKYGCKLIHLEKFGYGIALNLGIQNARNPIIVCFSAHCYPVNKDFFKAIKEGITDEKIAGLRPLTTDKDYRNFLEGKTAKDDLRNCGLANACSAFKKSLWEEHPFHDTMFAEDKEWTRYFLAKGYDVKLCESFASYHIKRNRAGSFNRYKQEFLGWSLLLGKRMGYAGAIKYFFWEIFKSITEACRNIILAFKRLFFHLNYVMKFKK
jgi:glycosyltransferase involved in cell wall biosynthesis